LSAMTVVKRFSQKLAHLASVVNINYIVIARLLLASTGHSDSEFVYKTFSLAFDQA
jgi:hypothetical protein